MAGDLTLDILSDREKYPDAREIQLEDGVVITVGQLRNSLQPRADFSRASEAWKREKQDLINANEAVTRQLQEALERKRQEEPPADRRSSGTFTEEELLADPVVGPLLKRQQALEAEIGGLRKEQELHRNTWLRNHMETQVAGIADHWNRTYNEDGKDPFNTDAFLEHVQKRPISVNGTVDLGLCYQDFARTKETERLTRAAEQKGIEKGKQLAKVPRVPTGRRASPPKPAGVEGTFQELSDDAILADPEMQAAMRGEEE